MESFPVVLFLIFLVLKLTGVIMWSWWWVTSPLWISLILAFGFYGIIGIIALLAVAGSSKQNKSKFL